MKDFNLESYLANNSLAQKIYNSCYKLENKKYYFSCKFEKFEIIENTKQLKDLIEYDYPEIVIFIKNKKVFDLPDNFFSLLFYNNVIDILIIKTDLFQSKNLLLEKVDKTLYLTYNNYTFRSPKNNLSEKQNNEIIEDYKKHFEELDQILEWIVACRFTDSRRSSFLHLRLSAGFGKSFLKSIFQDIGMLVECRYDDFKSPSSLNSKEFTNSIIMMIDEFTIFKKDFKDLTNNMILDSKNQLRTKVDLFAKIFLSAEKSNSFEDGADQQITDRLNIIDKEVEELEERKKYIYYGNKAYYQAVSSYIYNFIILRMKELQDLGEFESARKSEIFIHQFHDKFGLKTENLEVKIRQIFYETINNLIDLKNDIDFLTKEQIQISKNIILVDDYIYILQPKKTFDLILQNEDDEFYKKAKYKNSKMSEILKIEKSEIQKAHRVLINQTKKTIKSLKLTRSQILKYVEVPTIFETIKA